MLVFIIGLILGAAAGVFGALYFMETYYDVYEKE